MKNDKFCISCATATGRFAEQYSREAQLGSSIGSFLQLGKSRFVNKKAEMMNYMFLIDYGFFVLNWHKDFIREQLLVS